MPIEQYSRYFGGAKGSAQKALDSMTKQYGAKRGRNVFYAVVEKRRGNHRGGNGLQMAMQVGAGRKAKAAKRQ